MAKTERSTRESEQRQHTQWKPPSTLPEIEDRDGWTHRWIRTSLAGTSDNTNVSSRFREGWEPCKMEDYPELNVQIDRDSRFPANVEVGGLLLCRAPKELMLARAAYYIKQNDAAASSVDSHLMKDNDPRMPLFSERKTSVAFGSGSK